MTLKNLAEHIKGKAIFIEGSDGSTKTTIIEKLTQGNPNIVLPREPGGTPEAEQIREVILSPVLTKGERVLILLKLLRGKAINANTRRLLEKAVYHIGGNHLDGHAEMLLYAASRSESLEKVVGPARAAGKTVICGRSVASSMAYQGSGRGLDMDEVWHVNLPVIRSTLPDLEFYFDVPVDIVMERLSNRPEKRDRLDMEGRKFFENVRSGYLSYYKQYCPYPHVIIDASQSIEAVVLQMEYSLHEFYEHSGSAHTNK